MAVPKKDQERVTYAWTYGAQAPKDGKSREVPEYWQELTEAWLQRFDGHPVGSVIPPVRDQVEAELDEGAVRRSDGEEASASCFFPKLVPHG